MKRDIETREDLENLLREFYHVATLDDKIGHHFAELNLETHLPIIVDFWEKVLFGELVYSLKHAGQNLALSVQDFQ